MDVGAMKPVYGRDELDSAVPKLFLLACSCRTGIASTSLQTEIIQTLRIAQNANVAPHCLYGLLTVSEFAVKCSIKGGDCGRLESGRNKCVLTFVS